MGFIIAPYVLYRLGIERFAVWSILGSLLGYMSKIDLGVGTSYAKYISEYHAQKDDEKVNKVINSGFVYYVIVGCIMIGIAFWGQERLLNLFNIDVAIREEVDALFMYVVFISVGSSCLNIFNAILWGIQRSDVVHKIKMGSFAVEAICKVVFLELGYRLGAMVLASAITSAVSIVLCMVFAYKLFPQLRFNPLLFDKQIFRRMFKYGGQLHLSRIASMSQMHLGKLILAHFLPLSAVAIYDIGNRIALTIRSLPLTLLPSILPAASQLHALKDSASLERLFHRATKYVTILTVFLLAYFLAMMPQVVLSWMGTQIDAYEVSLVGNIIFWGYAYSLITNIAPLIVLSMGHPEYGVVASVITLCSNLGLNLMLIPLINVKGAALATMISEIFGRGYLMHVCHKKLKISSMRTARTIYLWPFVAGTMTFGIISGGYKLFLLFIGSPEGRIQNLSVVVLTGIVAVLIYAIFLFQKGYIDAYDRDLLRQYWKKFALRLDAFKALYRRRFSENKRV